MFYIYIYIYIYTYLYKEIGGRGLDREFAAKLAKRHLVVCLYGKNVYVN